MAVGANILAYHDVPVFREWMTMPKFIVSASSDEFFLIDDSHYFFDDLPGVKYLW